MAPRSTHCRRPHDWKVANSIVSASDVGPTKALVRDDAHGDVLSRVSDSLGRLLAGTSQAIGSRHRRPTVGAGVAPEFMPKRNAALVGCGGRTAGRVQSQGWRARGANAVGLVRRSCHRFLKQNVAGSRMGWCAVCPLWCWL